MIIVLLCHHGSVPHHHRGIQSYFVSVSVTNRSYGANRLLNLQGSKLNYVKLALSSRGSVHEKHNPRTIGSKAQHAKLI